MSLLEEPEVLSDTCSVEITGEAVVPVVTDDGSGSDDAKVSLLQLQEDSPS